MTDDKDTIILKSLLMGNHLNGRELERAEKLLFLLNVELKGRIK